MQPAGQIADLGGGALMAAFGILAALRERERSGEGQHVDVSMADGALSWLALVAARYFADGTLPGRGAHELAGGLGVLPAVRVRRRLGDAGRARAALLGGVVSRRRARGPRRAAVRRGRQRRARGGRGDLRGAHPRRMGAFASEVECCLEPVLGVDEALESELVAAREMVVGLDQPGASEPVRQLGAPVKLSRTPPDTNRLPGPALGEHTEAVLRAAGYDDAQIAELLRSGAVAAEHEGEGGSFLA